MDYVLTPNSVSHAIGDKIFEWIKTIDIARWRNPTTGGGGITFETRPLNIFTELSQFDPNDRNVYPYLFIRELNISARQRERMGNIIRWHYTYSYALGFYIDISPMDRMQVPRINEELSSMNLKLMRVLRDIEIWDDLIPVEISPPPQISDGVLHMFLRIKVFEDQIPYPDAKMENIEIDIDTMQKLDIETED